MLQKTPKLRRVVCIPSTHNKLYKHVGKSLLSSAYVVGYGAVRQGIDAFLYAVYSKNFVIRYGFAPIGNSNSVRRFEPPTWGRGGRRGSAMVPLDPSSRFVRVHERYRRTERRIEFVSHRLDLHGRPKIYAFAYLVKNLSKCCTVDLCRTLAALGMY